MNKTDRNFESTVRNAFAFLIEEFGFQLRQIESARVVFEGNGVFVTVSDWHTHYELGVEIGREVPDESYGLFEVLEVVAPEAAGRARYQYRDTAGLEKGLWVLADLLAKHCSSFLQNEPESFDRIRKSVQESRQRYTDRYRFGAIRDRAQIAWEERNFKKAMKLYLSIADNLTKIERRRLEYMRKIKD